ncbi:MAG: hypothetical protein GC160_30055 [Acidobacteria bacterium]|nr:hypothetical protein [Acidobacteriota bacterium]
MRRDSGIVRGLVDWLTGGLSARLDFLERDVDAIQREQAGMTRVLAQHHQELAEHRTQIQQQMDSMIALRKMHAALSEKIGQPFPGKTCLKCGSPMVFRRESEQKAYSLSCIQGCGERLLLPEAQLLETFARSAD